MGGTVPRLARICLALALSGAVTSAAVSQPDGPGDVFSSDSGSGRSGPGGDGADPECGGTNRTYYDRLYGTQAVVLTPAQAGQAERCGNVINCGSCRGNLICWLHDRSQFGGGDSPLIAQNNSGGTLQAETPELDESDGGSGGSSGRPPLRGGVTERGTAQPGGGAYSYPGDCNVDPNPPLSGGANRGRKPQQRQTPPPDRGQPQRQPPRTPADTVRLHASKERGPAGVAVLDANCRYEGKMLFPKGWVYVCLGDHPPGATVGGPISPASGRPSPYAQISGVFQYGAYYIRYLDGPISGYPKRVLLTPVR